jgi:broad specificity phosphatase PhoE
MTQPHRLRGGLSDERRSGRPADDWLTGDLVLIRHGQTKCTVEGRFCGAHEGELTPVGADMARFLAAHPALADAERLLSSPARRALDTAGPVAERTGLTVTVDERLRETAFGAWEDLLPADVAATRAHRRWTQDPALFAPTGGESGLTVLGRAVGAVRDALESSDRVIAVTHKAPVRLILGHFLGLPPDRYRDIGTVGVASVSWLRFQRGRATLKALGDVSHLPPTWRADPDHARSQTDEQAARAAKGR